MAQRVNVILVDDIDGSDAEETVAFGIDGTDYEIDLSKKHAAQLRDALSLYVAHARKSSRKRGGGRRTRGSDSGGASAAEIREWARQNGWDVSERGRVSAEVRAAYEAAN